MINEVDLILFAGQSNMAGRGGISEKFPAQIETVKKDAGFEYKAITRPDELVGIDISFGREENTAWGINDGAKKTGSLVPAFVNAYFEGNGNVPIVGVSASKGGSGIGMWQPDSKERFLEDAIYRLNQCIEFLKVQNIAVRHTFLLWCQGETDGDVGTCRTDYEKMLRKTLDEFMANGIEHIFMIQIGECNISESLDRYEDMIRWQKEIASKYDDVSLVSESFKTMRERGLMKDEFHYFQQAYNEVGREAGINTARFLNKSESLL